VKLEMLITHVLCR